MVNNPNPKELPLWLELVAEIHVVLLILLILMVVCACI